MLPRVGLGLAALTLFNLFTASLQALPISEEPRRVFYQMYVRAFYDGSLAPDGEGDFAGITAKADYLQELGVDTLLLMPIFHSTGDMGYIPRDYFRLDRAYGDDNGFRAFTQAMHARGIKIVLDAPVNHISFDSEWFIRGSQKRCDPRDVAHDPNDPDNKYCDYFYFVADPCRAEPYHRWHKPWHYDSTDCNAVWFQRPQFNAAYHRPERVYATFFSVMPDLKFYDFEQDRWHEPVVRDVERFFKHWAAAGVDGFRIDAAKHFVEGRQGNRDPQEPRNKELLARFLQAARSVNPDVSFLGEIWAEHGEFEPYLPYSLDMVLDFPFMSAVRGSVGGRYGEPLKRVLQHFEARQDVIKPGHRVVFAGNHDVTRLMSEWNDDEERVRLAHFATLLTPFTPLIYYGEELGTHGRVKRPDATNGDEWVRTIYAFPWHGEDDSVGFPGGLKPVTDVPDNYRERNLADARLDSGSLFYLVKGLLGVRRQFGVSNDTRLVVRQDLFGHVIGWTLVNPTRTGQSSCLSVMMNFNGDTAYDIDAQHADPTCRTQYREAFVEDARRMNAEGGGVTYRMAPNAKVVLRD
jgi:alpha-amylase